MNGADRYYNLILKAYEYGLGNLENFNNGNYRYKNITFSLGEHARGKTFHIYLWEDNDDSVNLTNLEVYGIVDGQPGWTESYGWIIEGAWIKCIMDYFDSLEKLILEKEKIIEEKMNKEKEINLKKNQEKIDKFNKMFA